MPNTATRPMHVESEAAHTDPPPAIAAPPLPEGMTLEDVLARSAMPPPPDFPQTINDDDVYHFVNVEQLEYRFANTGLNQLGWDIKAAVGTDYDKFYFKTEGDWSFDDGHGGESENDFLYSRLIAPFWDVQIGAQYANDWTEDDYNDRYSGVLALLGTLPYMIETDASLYLSTDGDLTANIELTYDWWLTQRLILQPRAEFILAARDIDDRNLGAGLAETNLDLRLRYEIEREIAPYIGLRYHLLTGETADIARRNGDDTEQIYLLVGLWMQF